MEKVEKGTALVPALQTETLKEQLRQEQEKSSDYLNRLKYLQADYENYRKRVEKELQERIQMSNEKLVESLLPVVDELELALLAGRSAKDKEALLEGVEMVLKKLYEVLGREGLARIETTGKQFDPAQHEAVIRVPSATLAEGVIIDEVRKGFSLRGKVLRPSMVKIAVLPESREAKPDVGGSE